MTTPTWFCKVQAWCLLIALCIFPGISHGEDPSVFSGPQPGEKMGEFGRTPKLNTAGGRDHWPRVFSLALAGAGIRGGTIVGSSDAVGESPRDRPVTPAELAATIYTLPGLLTGLQRQGLSAGAPGFGNCLAGKGP